MWDLLLVNGTVVDGTGRKAYVGDVAVKNGLIAAMSSADGSNRLVSQPAARTIDCTGRLVTPCWVDVHTHIDGQVSFDPLITPLAQAGCGTCIQGNCGVGFAPCLREDQKFLMQLMEGVEDIPLGTMEQAVNFEWGETFPEYMEFMQKQNLALDVGCLLGHGPLRVFCLRDRANEPDRPGGPSKSPVTNAEIENMMEVVEEAMKAGAMGFSTSRTLAHRDRAGALVPGTLASNAELMAIGATVGKFGKGKAVFEMASDFQCIDDVTYNEENKRERLAHFGKEFMWMRTLSKGFGVPISFCIAMPSAQKEMSHGYRQMLRQAEAANADGCQLSVQVLTRPQGILMCWESRSHPFIDCPSFHELWSKGRDENTGVFKPANKRMLWTDMDLKKRILAEAYQLVKANMDDNYMGLPYLHSNESTSEGAGNLNNAVTSPGALARMYVENSQHIYKFTNTYEPKAEDSVAMESARSGKQALEVLYDWLCERDGTSVVTHMFVGYANQSLDDIREQLIHPCTVPGLGDTGAHGGFLADPSSSSYLLAHWYRDRQGDFPLEFAVKLHSHDTAAIYGLDDRGTLEVGKLADINVIHLETLEVLEPKFVRDLPSNAGRWIQEVRGYDYTIKRGVITFKDGQPTGELPGQLILGPGHPSRNEKPGDAEDVGIISRTLGLGGGERQYYGLYDGTILGNVRMALSRVKWEAERQILEAMLAIFGADRTERIGYMVNDFFPLRSSKL